MRLTANDEPVADEEAFPTEMPSPREGVDSEVALVVPAPAYDSIATDDALNPPAAIPSPPPDASPNPGPAIEAVRALGEGLHLKLDGLQTLFEREVRAEATREKVVDRLHAELQEYKQDLLLNILRPLFVDLIQLHDDIGKMVDAQAVEGGDPQASGEVRRILDVMIGYQQGIEDILDRQGVEPYRHEGDRFDPRRQRAVATVPTDDPALVKTIAVRHRKGFQARGGDRVIRPEIVSVYALNRQA